ncbi:MAG: hypothetical protein ACOCW2_01535 [Chitinivibrionales bacterium]
MKRLMRFGIYHMVIGRLLGKTGIRNLSQHYLSGNLSVGSLVKKIRQHRHRYYKSIDKELIIESYYQWYGVLPAIPHAFKQYKIVAVVRDPRTWVSSWINFGAHYGSKDSVMSCGKSRLNPSMIGDTFYIDRWHEMSRFQKLCWTWKTVYTTIVDFIRGNQNAMLVRYEDIFLSSDKQIHASLLLNFITTFADRSFPFSLHSDLLEKKIHATDRKQFPDWQQWDRKTCKQLSEICEPLMHSLGYGRERDWQDMVGET